MTREMRRRTQEAQRSGRGFTPPGPGTPGRTRRGGGCCLIVILAIIALFVYAYVTSYVIKPKEDKEGMGPVRTVVASEMG